jgi:hypothetical protein
VKCYDIDIPQVSHVVATSKIGELLRFACFYPFFAYETENPIPSAFNDGLARMISLERIFLGSTSAVAGWCDSIESDMSSP